MSEFIDRAIAIVGIGAILPDAPDAASFWANLTAGRYSISEVPGDRWDPARYYDADPHAADKTYSKIGGWVRSFAWDPARWKLPVPPRVGDAMDDGQKWAVACTREALIDAGHPDRPLDQFGWQAGTKQRTRNGRTVTDHAARRACRQTDLCAICAELYPAASGRRD